MGLDWIETSFGFQSIVWTFVRHTVSRCLIFPALPEVTRSRGQTQSTHVASSSSHLRVNMGCALAIVFQVRSLYIPTITGYPSWSLFPGVPNL